MRLSSLMSLMVALIFVGRAMANPIPSDNIPQHVLDECDEQAVAYPHYDKTILAAADALVALGVFSKSEFHDIKIGFCDLQRVQGPVATTSCARNTILMDRKYLRKDQRLVLNATLAHEMKHYFQHERQKARFGENYCSTDRYDADKAWMEKEADEFGDNVAALLFGGRSVEITNECPATVSVYLETDAPGAAARDFGGFIDVPPQGTILTPGQSTSKLFKYYAQSEPHDGRRWVWRGAGAHKRIIDGKTIALKRITLPNQSRSTGPFRLKLTCPQDRPR